MEDKNKCEVKLQLTSAIILNVFKHESQPIKNKIDVFKSRSEMLSV